MERRRRINGCRGFRIDSELAAVAFSILEVVTLAQVESGKDLKTPSIMSSNLKDILQRDRDTVINRNKFLHI